MSSCNAQFVCYTVLLAATAMAVPPANDRCINALPLEPFQTLPGTTVDADQHPETFASCEGHEPGGNGVWYSVYGYGVSVRLTLECVNGEHELLVFCDNCDHLQCLETPIACGQTLEWCAGYGVYRVLVRSSTAPGDFNLVFEETETACQSLEGCASWPPHHDRCGSYFELWPPFELHATTVGASQYPDLFPGCDGRVPGGDGVWFFVLQSGTDITLTLECESEHELLVFCTECYEPQWNEHVPLCIAPPITCGQSVTWCGYDDALLLVRSLGEPGDFTIRAAVSEEFCNQPRNCYQQLGNDLCSGAAPISIGQTGDGHADSFGANDEGDPGCGASEGGSDWFKVMGNGTTLTASICSFPPENPLHALSIFCNSCDAPRCLPDGFLTSECGQDQVSWCSKAGDWYYLRVDGPLLSSQGMYDLTIESDNVACAPALECAPPNDTCQTATLLSPGEQMPVSLEGASADAAPYCYAPGAWPGIWFDVVGDGTVMEIALCVVDGDRPWVKMYCGDCVSPGCIVAVEYAEDCRYPDYPCPDYQCQVETWKWCTREGEVYHIQLIDNYPGAYLVSAQSTGTPCGNGGDCTYHPPPANDDCAEAIPISGEGVFDFENAHATPENEYQMCHFTGYVPPTHDVWYCWTSPCDGPVTVETCGLTTIDTQLAVFEGCDCEQTTELGCNNDECGYQSRVDFMAVAGQTYRIQVGTRIDLFGGAGQFRISCGAQPPIGQPCQAQPFDPCVSPSNEDAINSTRGQFVAAGHFMNFPTGSVGEVCWWGTNFDGNDYCTRSAPDDFRITYYADYCGKPWGTIAGPFSQSEGTLTVTGLARTPANIAGTLPELTYSATHQDVSLTAGETYWIEITNSADGACSWLWETIRKEAAVSFQSAGDQSISADAEMMPAGLAFDVRSFGSVCAERDYAPACLPPPPHDHCWSTGYLSLNLPKCPPFTLCGVIPFVTRGAQTDGESVMPEGSPETGLINYFPLGDRQVHNDIWFNLDVPCAGFVAVDICEADFDSKAALYHYTNDGSCPTADGDSPIAINDDACGPDLELQSRLSAWVEQGTYLLRVGGYRGAYGSGELLAAYAPPDPSDLKAFAAWANCRSYECKGEFCFPTYPEGCCLANDFDADGDVDLDDYLQIYETLVGP